MLTTLIPAADAPPTAQYRALVGWMIASWLVPIVVMAVACRCWP